MLKVIKKQKSFISNIIIFLLTIVLVISFVNSLLIEKNLKKSIINNAYIVNKLGQIRGLIQRYSKDALIDKNTKPVKNEIDKTFDKIETFIKSDYTIPKNMKNKFYEYFNTVKKEWRMILNTKDKDRLYKLSEKTWHSADILTTYAQLISEYKNKKFIKFITTISIISVLFIILIVIIVYILIRNGLEREKITDPLTRLYNRRYFLDAFEYCIQIYNRYKRPFSVIFLDIDNFKQINDTFGHQKGDEVLMEFANTILDSLRTTDMAFRYGGEEIVIILPETKIEEAVLFAKRLRENIKKNIKVNSRPITASIGVGEYQGEGMFEFIKKVDECVYKAKRTGKDKVVVNY